MNKVPVLVVTESSWGQCEEDLRAQGWEPQRWRAGEDWQACLDELARLREEAQRDGLTGLFNRRHFDRRLNRELVRCRAQGRTLSLIFVDLDDFGAVNRDRGYPAGDEALRTAARVLDQGIRTVDWCARYGGEELVVVLPDTPLSEATDVAHRLRRTLASTPIVAVGGPGFRVTGSCGVVEWSPEDSCDAAFVHRAGLAVRRAKTGGKNRVVASEFLQVLVEGDHRRAGVEVGRRPSRRGTALPESTLG